MISMIITIGMIRTLTVPNQNEVWFRTFWCKTLSDMPQIDLEFQAIVNQVKICSLLHLIVVSFPKVVAFQMNYY